MKKVSICFIVLTMVLFSGEVSGTGFFISPKYVLTNFHVVKDAESIEIYREGHSDKATLYVWDVMSDLALLRTEKKCKTHLEFSSKKIRLGEEVVVLGYPLGVLLGTGLKVTRGNISALTGLINDSNQMQITAPVQPGNSGGPLLNDTGNVIGVVVAKFNDKSAENVNFAIKRGTVINFLDSHGIGYEMNDSKESFEIPDIVERARPSVVQVVCKSRESHPTKVKKVLYENKSTVLRDEVFRVIKTVSEANSLEKYRKILFLYSDYVDYYEDGVVTRDFIYRDKVKYFKKWPIAYYRIGKIYEVDDIGNGKVKVRYSIHFDVYNPYKNKGIRGEALNTLILQRKAGRLEIVSEKSSVLSRQRYSK
jgi:V8-like Glu-specific endopeptidase